MRLFVDFQLAYAPSSFAIELSSWRSVIYLNLTRSILTILDFLTKEASRSKAAAAAASSASSLEAPTSQSSLVAMASSSSAEDDPEADFNFKVTPSSTPYVSNSELGIDDAPGSPSSPFPAAFPPELAEHAARAAATARPQTAPADRFCLTQAHAALLARLQPPLLKVQETLEASLGAPEPSPNSPYGAHALALSPTTTTPHEPSWRPANMRKPKEFAITTRTGWRAALMKVRERMSTSSSASIHSVGSTSGKKAGKRKKREDMDADEVREVLCELGADMQALWEDESVRALLQKRKVRMDERSGL